jgi:hypothetical protein
MAALKQCLGPSELQLDKKPRPQLSNISFNTADSPLRLKMYLRFSISFY